MEFKLTIRPRISETDLMGHINNITPAVWMEEGRTYFFTELIRDRKQFPPLMIRHVEIDYRDQIYQEHLAEIRTSVAKIGNTSVRLHQEIIQTERLCVVGRSTLVFVDPEHFRPCPVPQILLERFGPYLREQGED